MKAWLSVVISMSVLSRCNGPSDKELVAQFAYERVIQDATPSDLNDRREVFEACLKLWNADSSSRVGVLRDLRKSGYLRQPGTVFMETGSLTWGGYDYVLAVKDKVPSRNGALKLADASFWTKVRPADLSALQSDATMKGHDPSCSFITIVQANGTLKQVAIINESNIPAVRRTLASMQEFTHLRP